MTQPAVLLRVARVGDVHVELPSYQTAGSAGMDLRAAIGASVRIEPGRRALIPTGIALAIPAGYEGQVRPRSGLASKHGVTVVNAPGTIDSDYRGEVKVALINLGDVAFDVAPGDRIAQLLISPVARAELVLVEGLDETARGAGGHGSTGIG